MILITLWQIKLRFESSAEFTNDASSGSGTCVDYRIAYVNSPLIHPKTFTATIEWLTNNVERTVERVWIEDP